ncbi:hypothetical protein DR92_2211 [Brucella anthropi]|nr:hypothetical protein DR92_2211 [Brucella anthropi]
MIGDRADAMLEDMDEARHEGKYHRIEVITGRRQRRNWVIPPFLTGLVSRIHAAIFSFCAGVTPPMPILGRSLL